MSSYRVTYIMHCYCFRYIVYFKCIKYNMELIGLG